MTDEQFAAWMAAQAIQQGVLQDVRSLMVALVLAAGIFLGCWLWDFMVRMFSYGAFITRE